MDLKTSFVAAIAFGTFGISLAGTPEESHDAYQIAGTWKFHELSHDGVRQPRPNPDLQLYYRLDPDFRSTLYWTRTGERMFCQREGRWHLEGNLIHDEILKAHADNSPECAQDPDMRPGRTSVTPISIIDGEIWMSLNAGENPIIYIWRRTAFREFP